MNCFRIICLGRQPGSVVGDCVWMNVEMTAMIGAAGRGRRATRGGFAALGMHGVPRQVCLFYSERGCMLGCLLYIRTVRKSVIVRHRWATRRLMARYSNGIGDRFNDGNLHIIRGEAGRRRKNCDFLICMWLLVAGWRILLKFGNVCRFLRFDIVTLWSKHRMAINNCDFFVRLATYLKFYDGIPYCQSNICDTSQ